MRYLLATITLLLTINGNAQDDTVNKHPWFVFHHLKFEDFVLESGPQKAYIDYGELESTDEYLEIFTSVFIYAPNKEHYVDLDSYTLSLEKDEQGNLFSYGGEVDSKAILVDVTKHQSYELMFCGSICSPEDAIWLTNDKFWLVSVEYNSTENKLYPYIWEYDLVNNMFKSYRSTKPSRRSMSDYLPKVRLSQVEFK